MDYPTPEEDGDLLASDPLDVVEHVLLAENLAFDRTDDGDLAFALNGDWKDYELWFAWRAEAACLQLCLSLDMRVDYLRPAVPGRRIVGRGECYRVTRSIGFVRGVAHDGDVDDPVAHVTGTFMFTKPA